MKLLIIIRFAFALTFLLICCFAAQAQTAAVVSGLGSDANPCTRISPCRSFQRAHDVVNAGGEVIAMDSAGYGPVTITKSVSIIGDGVYAGINTNSGHGITIATAGATVNLRSLIIEGLNSATDGIHATDFTALHIENCTVSGFANDGIQVFPTTGGIRKVYIKDSISRNNARYGVAIIGGGGTPFLIATIEGTRAENNFSGFVSIAIVTARECSASSNLTDGFLSWNGGLLNIESSIASNNGRWGIATLMGTLRVATSTSTNNTEFGFFNGTGTFESRGDNTVRGNGSQTAGVITPLTAL